MVATSAVWCFVALWVLDCCGLCVFVLPWFMVLSEFCLFWVICCLV